MSKRPKRPKPVVKPIAKPDDDDNTYLLCCPARQKWAKIEGSKTGYFCSRCKGEVMLAPSGQKLYAQGGILLLCMDCSAKQGDAKFEIRMPHTRDVIRELEIERIKMVNEMQDPASTEGRKAELARQVSQLEDTQNWLRLEQFKNSHRN